MEVYWKWVWTEKKCSVQGGVRYIVVFAMGVFTVDHHKKLSHFRKRNVCHVLLYPLNLFQSMTPTSKHICLLEGLSFSSDTLERKMLLSARICSNREVTTES